MTEARSTTSDSPAVAQSRLPNLVMVGPGKAGTTSLFFYLSQHPDICPSDVKEIKYFAPLASRSGELAPVETYAAHFSGCAGQRSRLEASPQYFHGGAPLIDALQALLPQPKVIITLRNPVDRIWSTYRSAKIRRFLPEQVTFDEYVARCEQVLEDGAGAADDPERRPYRTLYGSFYAPSTRAWLDALGDDARVVFFEQLAGDPVRLLADLCRWLAIDAEVVPGFDLTTQNETRAAQSFLLHRVAVGANSERLLGSRRRL
jgi:hypothetical protein